MIAHDGIAKNFDAHDASEKFQTFADQSATMIVVFTGKLVITAEKRTSDTAIDAVHDLNVLIRQNIPSICSSHDECPRLMLLWIMDKSSKPKMLKPQKNSTTTH